jgi:putative methionine-R-sulfoxide reductase with GAF domain
VGVLDIDSERLAHFDDADRDGLVPIVALVYA